MFVKFLNWIVLSVQIILLLLKNEVTIYIIIISIG